MYSPHIEVKMAQAEKTPNEGLKNRVRKAPVAMVLQPQLGESGHHVIAVQAQSYSFLVVCSLDGPLEPLWPLEPLPVPFIDLSPKDSSSFKARGD